MGDDINLLDQEEEEEALSLRNFPITSDGDRTVENEAPSNPKNLDRRSSSEPTDFFEFFNDLSFEMSYAEDIIFRGKLMPVNEQGLPNQARGLDNQRSFHRHRSESLPALKTSQSTGEKTSFMRTSRSLDGRTLRRISSTSSATVEIRRNASNGAAGKSENSGQKVSRPRWYVLMFGLVRSPPDMELKDMKSRRARQASTTMFPPAIDACSGNFLAKRSHHRKGSWDLLKILSCKDHASVAVATSFGCVPQPDAGFSRATCI
ncbi:hypothetical protein NMG60_11005732 [Bertholletia excelsa]